MPPTTTGAAARPSGAHSVFVQDEIAAFPFLEAADVKKHHKEQLRASSERVISSSYAAPPAADNEGAASTWEVDATVPSIDRVYKYGRHFKLDEPFTLRLRKGETVLLPLEPIHDLLFPSSIASTTNSTTQEKEQATSPLAIGLELSNCQGRVQSFIVRKSDRASRFSTASYQCVTISHASKAQQQRVNLCPHYDPQFPVALFEDPSNIKGFLLRADVDEPVESIVLLRSTKSSGGFEKAFVVPDDDDDDDDRPSQSPFNVSFSYEATTLGFESPSIWDHSNDTPNESLLSSELKACEACEYFLYAEKLTTNQTVHTVAADFVESSSTQLALPYCIRQRSSVQYQLPKLIASTSSSTSDGKIHHRHNVKLDDLFADHFRSSGEYRFVLMASLPSSANHQHPAMLAYAPQQLVVTVPPFYQSHFFVAFVVVVLFAVAAILQVQYQPHRHFFSRKTKPSMSDAEDEAEFVSLLAHSAATNGPRGEDAMDSLEEGLLAGEHDADDDSGDDLDTNGGVRTRSSLLEAIKRTKEQQPAAVDLDGYHEIN